MVALQFGICAAGYQLLAVKSKCFELDRFFAREVDRSFSIWNILKKLM
jgi:hypothetical protein